MLIPQAMPFPSHSQTTNDKQQNPAGSQAHSELISVSHGPVLMLTQLSDRDAPSVQLVVPPMFALHAPTCDMAGNACFYLKPNLTQTTNPDAHYNLRPHTLTCLLPGSDRQRGELQGATAPLGSPKVLRCPGNNTQRLDHPGMTFKQPRRLSRFAHWYSCKAKSLTGPKQPGDSRQSRLFPGPHRFSGPTALQAASFMDKRGLPTSSCC